MMVADDQLPELVARLGALDATVRVQLRREAAEANPACCMTFLLRLGCLADWAGVQQLLEDFRAASCSRSETALAASLKSSVVSELRLGEAGPGLLRAELCRDRKPSA